MPAGNEQDGDARIGAEGALEAARQARFGERVVDAEAHRAAPLGRLLRRVPAGEGRCRQGSGDEEAAARHPCIIAAGDRGPRSGGRWDRRSKGVRPGATLASSPRTSAPPRPLRHRPTSRDPPAAAIRSGQAPRSPLSRSPRPRRSIARIHLLRACHDCIAHEPLFRPRNRHARPGACSPRQADRLGRRDGRADRRQGRLLVRRQRCRVRAPRRPALRRRHLHQARSGAAPAQLPGAQQPERRRRVERTAPSSAASARRTRARPTTGRRPPRCARSCRPASPTARRRSFAAAWPAARCTSCRSRWARSAPTSRTSASS